MYKLKGYTDSLNISYQIKSNQKGKGKHTGKTPSLDSGGTKKIYQNLLKKGGKRHGAVKSKKGN